MLPKNTLENSKLPWKVIDYVDYEYLNNVFQNFPM